MCSASFFKSVIVCSSVFLLVACGGGGGSTKNPVSSSQSSSSSSNQNSSSSSVKMSQTLDFEVDGEMVVLAEGETHNKATGPGSGAIVYESSNYNIATVDNNGDVQAFNVPGIVTITANIASDDQFLAATASYTLKIIPKTVPVTLWIGKDNTQVEFSTDVAGFEFYRTTESACDTNFIEACEHGQLDIIAQSPIIDTAVTDNRAAFYTLKLGKFQGKTEIDPMPVDNTGRALLPIASTHDVLVHNNKLVFVGDGRSEWPAHVIWTSVDGMQWEQKNAVMLTITRSHYNISSFNDQLWMIGGQLSTSIGKSIYSSLSMLFGIGWDATENENAFAWRYQHQTVIFKDKLWVIGGMGDVGDSVAPKNDVWSSVDGNEWVEESTSAEFSARWGHQVVVFNDKLWLIAGGNENDVWSSVDGVNWVQEVENADFAPRRGHQVVVHNNKLWLIGGKFSVSYNDVWSSSDGVNWVRELEFAPFSARSGHQLVSFNNKLILIGGNNGEDQNDIWSSTDGVNWRKGFAGTVEITDSSAEVTN